MGFRKQSITETQIDITVFSTNSYIVFIYAYYVKTNHVKVWLVEAMLKKVNTRLKLDRHLGKFASY